MKGSTLEMLRCPFCKGKMTLASEFSDDVQITNGSLLCQTCARKFQIRNGIPLLYVPDDEVIARAHPTKFDYLVITPSRLSALAECITPRNRLGILSRKKISHILVLSGWVSVFSGLLFLGYAAITVAAPIHSQTVPVAFSLITLSICCFILDYFIHRMQARDQYERQLYKLLELSNLSKLSEYDSRREIKDKKECYGDISNATPKAKEISATLREYNFNGGKGLNIGCGGELHQQVSKPFFSRGYDMLGIDICEDYLMEYSRIFKTDGILANSMALPLKNSIFDLINYTDILEHLHHPFLGLCEANRVLKNGGRIILATPYRCRCSPRCINPLVFFEAIVSLYHDKILGPRSIVSGFQDMAYYHLEFSKSEITDMLESSGFELSGFDTYFAKSKVLTRLFRKLPVLRFMGGALIAIGIKRDACRSQEN
jgi:uncharacterized protein YbaR (Trm112 family)/SAM-dependent methyltransferase